MSKNYIDVKYTIWQRAEFEDDADMDNIVKQLRDSMSDFAGEVIYDEKLGFIENSPLFNTEEEVTVEDNNGASTIEVYKNDKMIWENGTY